MEILELDKINKKLTQECQILTVRMLEEKNKMIEMLNETNSLFNNQKMD